MSKTNKDNRRDYQSKACIDTINALKIHRAVMLQSPTASGKSIIIAVLIKYYLDIFKHYLAQNKKILFCVNLRDLVTQIYATLKEEGINSGVIMAGIKPNYLEKVQVSSIQSFTKLLEKRLKNKEAIAAADYIIIDEAHGSKSESYSKLWELYPNAKIIGLTATPYRLNGKGFDDLFSILIQTQSIKQLINRGFLVPFKYLVCSIPDYEKVKMNKITEDYDSRSSASAVETAPFVESYRKHCEGKKGIVFCANVDHSIETAETYQKAGIKAVHVDAKTPSKLRNQIIEDFKNNKIDILCNVGLFTTGFDVPNVDFIQLLRMTKSLSLYLQMVGRGGRVLPNTIHNSQTNQERVLAIQKSKKPHCIILDHAGLFKDHGLPTKNHDWQGYFKGWEKLKIKKEQETENVFFFLNNKGNIGRTNKLVETEGMELIEMTEDDYYLIVFEQYLQDAIKLKHKIFSVYYRFVKFLKQQQLELTETMKAHVQKRLNQWNEIVEKPFRFKPDVWKYENHVKPEIPAKEEVLENE